MAQQNALTAELIKQWEKEPNSHQKLTLLCNLNDYYPDGTFPILDDDIKKLLLSHILDTWTSVSEQIRFHQLQFLRIILRDKNSSDLDTDDTEESKYEPIKIVLESEKCLVNLLFNSAKARALFQMAPFGRLVSRIHSISAIYGGVSTLSVGYEYLAEWSVDKVEELLLYDLKIAFITTALIQKIRNDCVNDTDKTTVFLNLLVYSLEKVPALMACKYMFDMDTSGKCADACARIVKCVNLDLETKQNAVNLLSVLTSAVPSLCPKVETNEISDTSVAMEGFDMSFLNSLLHVFEVQIDKYEKKQIIIEFLGTFLTILSHLCSEHKAARRFCRMKILPPLTGDDVRRRPEEGGSFRNKMVRLMSSTSRYGEMTAEILFVLCKRSVCRLMKYCGFGHSAGLLANYGFLGQATTAQRRPSDSEDSETEEYKRVEEKVNPVTGSIPPPEQLGEWRRQLESMSDEQREYEMMKLVDCMDKLMPGVVGEDGELRQAKHVAELIKDVKTENESDDD
uniref:Synembryn n=1 Tax=Globodera rostochiensis TaxID=31243 RepID=A0A914H7D4_GLORO